MRIQAHIPALRAAQTGVASVMEFRAGAVAQRRAFVSMCRERWKAGTAERIAALAAAAAATVEPEQVARTPAAPRKKAKKGGGAGARGAAAAPRAAAAGGDRSGVDAACATPYEGVRAGCTPARLAELCAAEETRRRAWRAPLPLV